MEASKSPVKEESQLLREKITSIYESRRLLSNNLYRITLKSDRASSDNQSYGERD